MNDAAIKIRALKPDEIALFPQSFTDAIDIESVRFIFRAHNPLAAKKILVRGNQIFWPNCPLDFTQDSVDKQALLMHELCHVWQYHTRRLTAFRYLTRPKHWTYHYGFDRAKSFDDYPIEKQADLLQDWYLMNMGAPPQRFKRGTQAPSLEQINQTVPFIWPAQKPSGNPKADEPIRRV